MRDFSFGLAPDTVPHLYPKEEYNFFHSSTRIRSTTTAIEIGKGADFLNQMNIFQEITAGKLAFLQVTLQSSALPKGLRHNCLRLRFF
ncbi:hypothetical protein [Peribacillus frigoritolerans]|uniref:Uncharacterized protein n=1 Tax=Peribacillus castrilensis TaxID=2897690 RepID=A0AAW9NJ99_9BACI|nr:hypothetical protein [Peribacillus castrilensis]